VKAIRRLLDERSDRALLRAAAKSSMVFAVYVAVAKLGSMSGVVLGAVPTVWAPTGLSLAAIVLLGYRVFPGIFLGAVVVTLWTRHSVPVSLAIALGTTLEAVLGAWAMRRLTGFSGSFDRLRHAVGLIVPAAMISTLLGATVGVTSLTLGGIVPSQGFWESWQSWWLGDTLDDLILAPLLLTWATAHSMRCRPGRAAEAMLLVGVLLTESLVIFLRAPLPAAHTFQHAYVLFLLFIWAAVRFEVRGAATATAIAFGPALYGAAHRTGPFTRDTIAASIFALQMFMVFASMTSLVVAGAIADRARAVREAYEQSRELRILAEASSSFARAIHESDTILKELARSCTALFGDTCLVELVTREPDALRIAVLGAKETDDRELAERLLLGRLVPRTGVRGEVLDRKAHVLVPAGDRRVSEVIADPAYQAFIEQRAVHTLLAVPLNAGGDVVGVVTLLRHASGKPYTHAELTLLRDVADRGGLAIYSAQLYREVKAGVAVRDDFLAVAGHELKTPLSALLMQIQSLQRAVQKDPTTPIADRLAKAARSGLRMERLTNQLLDVSKIAAGKLRLEPEPLDLGEVLREVTARFADSGISENSRVSIQGEAHVDGYWDRLRIDEVISNILSNAIKYGEGKPVEIDLHAEDGEAVLRVADHGIGIDAAHQTKMFQKFERAVSAREYGGFGLGLWITRQIVEHCGGSIQVESATGQGSVFTVRLPRTQPPSLSTASHGDA
jgi:signal transduction histidine kinase/integral membrane sensor domain MASE1